MILFIVGVIVGALGLTLSGTLMGVYISRRAARNLPEINLDIPMPIDTFPPKDSEA